MPSPSVSPSSSAEPGAASAWLDTRGRFGRISRWLHWTMALLFLWQFTGMALKELLGRTPVSAFWVGTHRDVGLLLFVLLVVRAGWGLYNLGRRPHHQAGLFGTLALLGHGALYGLMLVVPSLALMRQYGSGRPFTPFGIPLMGPSEPIAWMRVPADLVHGPLAWLLLALIAGHVAMALVHRFVWRDGVLARMVGRVRD